MSRTIRTTLPEDVGQAIDRLCEEGGMTPAMWMRSLALREVRAQGSVVDGAVYGCVCGCRRHRHVAQRGRDGDSYGACIDCKKCKQYRQAAPPEDRPS